MIKPTKPSETLPNSFGGIKENFSNDKISSGYEPDVPEILGGANLNYLLDTLGKKDIYHDAITDFINNMPIAKTITVDTNNNLVYKDLLGGRNFGEIVYSAMPLNDSGLKLLDGSVIQGNGIYSNFVNYIASIVNTYPSIFVTESVWQQNVVTYGVCGKFVYDSINNTVRLPKVTGIIEGTVDVNALGSIVQAGLPQHSHNVSETGAGQHEHNRGNMNITGKTHYAFGDGNVQQAEGAFYSGYSGQYAMGTYLPIYIGGVVDIFEAARTWTGVTNTIGNHTHNVSISNANNAIYKTSVSTVQPQTVKMYVYMVVANGVTKTDVELDIDEIVSDLNGKADVDGSNLIENISTSAKDYFTELSLPSTRYINLTLGSSGDTYIAPATGTFALSSTFDANGVLYMYRSANNRYGYGIPYYANTWIDNSINVEKGTQITIVYQGNANVHNFVFIYANGAESEE